MEKPPAATVDSGSSSEDRWTRLIPSGITFLAVAGLIVAARFYAWIPIKPAPCGMRTMTGLPCLGCGGTRSMRALAEGDFLAAVTFNPLAMLGVLFVLGWFLLNLWRATTATAPRPRRKLSGRWIATICIALALANWIYLVWTLPS